MNLRVVYCWNLRRKQPKFDVGGDRLSPFLCYFTNFIWSKTPDSSLILYTFASMPTQFFVQHHKPNVRSQNLIIINNKKEPALTGSFPISLTYITRKFLNSTVTVPSGFLVISTSSISLTCSFLGGVISHSKNNSTTVVLFLNFVFAFYSFFNIICRGQGVC